MFLDVCVYHNIFTLRRALTTLEKALYDTPTSQILLKLHGKQLDRVDGGGFDYVERQVCVAEVSRS